MKILVCVKQVPESEASIGINDSARWIHTDASTTFRMNRFDEFAVEEALKIQETLPNTTIDVISVGPDRSGIVVRRALGMGASHGIHITTAHQDPIDPFVIASWIASYAKEKDYSLILTGVLAEDTMQGQVGPMVAERLSLPCATACIFERLSRDTESIYVEREIEGGYRDTLELRLPAVLTIQSGINQPRYPSLSNILRAKKRDLEIIDAASLEQPESHQDVVRLEYPNKSRSGWVVEGTEQKKAEKLLQILTDKSLLR